MSTALRMDSITLHENNRNIDMFNLESVHPFEDLINNNSILTDWFLNLQPCEMDSIHIYTSDVYNQSLIEPPPVNLLSATRLDVEDLELIIEDANSTDDAEGSIGSQTWQTSSYTPDREENMLLADSSDDLWHLREEEGAFQHFQSPGTFPRPAHQPLPGINEAMNESTMFNASNSDKQDMIKDIDNSINTNIDGEHFEGLGIYKIFGMPEGAQNESAARGTNVHQSSRRRRQMVDSSIELTHQEFVDMVSANDVRIANDRASRKESMAGIRHVFSQLVFSPSCAVHALELKEMWMCYRIPGRMDVDQAVPMSITNTLYERDVLQDMEDNFLEFEDPEEARGQLEDMVDDVFIWNQTDYLIEENNATSESRAGSAVRSIASMSDAGLHTVFGHESKSNT
ncbi:unnamed protein product [Umbelopsis vinacea]